MSSWLKPVVVAAAVMITLWALLVVLAARLPAGLLKDLAGFLPACVTLTRRQAVALPTAGHVLLSLANAAVLIVLVLLLRGWLPGRSRKPGASHT
jgi:hypothetical protein